MPMKPPLTSAQRRGETCSFKKVPATSVSTRGAVSMMAVNSPTDMNFRLRKTNRVLVTSMNPRSTWNRGWRVRITDQPPQGTTTTEVAIA